MTDRIWCQVSGGVTGYRSGWLKWDDEIVVFKHLEDAKAEAKALNDRTDSNPNRKATFSYTVQEYRVSDLKSHA